MTSQRHPGTPVPSTGARPPRALTLLFLFLPCFMLAGQGPPKEGSTLTQALTQAQQLIERGDLDGAHKCLTKAMRDFPNEPGIYNFLGVVDGQEGNYPAAERNFSKALSLAPRYEGAYLNLGRLYQEHAANDSEALQKAVGVYRRLLGVNPESLEAKYQLAVLYNRQGDFQNSLKYLKLIPSTDQGRAQALSLFCADYVGTGEIEKAKQAAGRLTESSDLREPEVLAILPVLAAQQAQDLAVQLLEAVDRRGLATPNGLFQLGVLYERKGKLGQARQVLLRAAYLKPNTVPILVELARVAEKQKDYEEALSYLAHARDLEPWNASIHFFFGVVCVEMNLIEEAYRSLKQAVTLSPENAYHNYAMGVASEAKSQHTEAVRYFERYCALKPEDARGRLALGIAHFYAHDRDAALKELSFSQKHSETVAAADYFLARLANQDGNLVEASHLIEESLKLAPDFAAAHAELGQLRMKKKEYAQAEEALRKALELEPENYQAHLYLTMLYSRTHDPRAEAQSRAFDELRKKRSEKVKEFYRIIDVRPPG